VTRLIIADAHVGHTGADADDMVRLVGHAADAGFGELIYLGDAFQYLIGMAKFWTPAVRTVLSEWDRAVILRLGTRFGGRPATPRSQVRLVHGHRLIRALARSA
jgi:hypothetical protein